MFGAPKDGKSSYKLYHIFLLANFSLHKDCIVKLPFDLYCVVNNLTDDSPAVTHFDQSCVDIKINVVNEKVNGENGFSEDGLVSAKRVTKVVKCEVPE